MNGFSAIFPLVGKVLRFFGIANYPEDVIDFFKKIIDDAIDMRRSGKKEKQVSSIKRDCKNRGI